MTSSHSEGHVPNCSVAMYGSSHIRELYLEMVRQHLGLPVLTPACNADVLEWNAGLKCLPLQFYPVGSGNPDKDGDRAQCDPGRTGWVRTRSRVHALPLPCTPDPPVPSVAMHTGPPLPFFPALRFNRSLVSTLVGTSFELVGC